MPICKCPTCVSISPKGLKVTYMVKYHHTQSAILDAVQGSKDDYSKKKSCKKDALSREEVAKTHICAVEDDIPMIDDFTVSSDSPRPSEDFVGVEHMNAAASTISTTAEAATCHLLNGNDSHDTPSTSTLPSLRRSSRAHIPRRPREVLSLVERRRQEQQAAVESAEGAMQPNEIETEANSGVSLGLYDDPDDLASIQRDLAEPEPLPPPLSPFADAVSSDIILSEFDPPPPKRTPLDIFNGSHDLLFVRIILLITAFLHIRHHVSFTACSVLLSCLNSLFIYLRLLPSDDSSKQIPVNFATVIKKLDLIDRFRVFPVCPSCHQLYKSSIPINSRCTSCNAALYNPPSKRLFQRLTNRKPPPPPPICAAPLLTLSSLLRDFLLQDGIEDAVELWRRRDVIPDTYTDIMDGEIWRTMRGSDGKLFFGVPEDAAELRLGVTISLDWFGRKSSVFGPSHSSGALSFCVSNLPIELRYRVQNLLIAAMTPGPVEPTAEQLQHYMKFIIDDLLVLYESGIQISTPAYPGGRTVRVVLLAVVCDHPAMCKLSGFSDHVHKAERPRMQATEGYNFLRLSASLKIFLGSSVQRSELSRAETLLRDYLLTYKKLYPEKNAMKPNHHWSIHLADQIRDHGPVYSFWTFLGERLNKNLKSFNSNGWTGGQMEISMMRSFGRDTQLQYLLKALRLAVVNAEETASVVSIFTRMIGSKSEAHGTIQDAATNVYHSKEGKHIQLGRVTNSCTSLSSPIRAALHKYYNSTNHITVHYQLSQPSSTISYPLRERAQFYQYAVLSGRRITPTSRSLRKSLGSSIILVRWEGLRCAGELRNIFRHTQPGFADGAVLFAEVQWMVPLNDQLSVMHVYEDFPELGVQFWEHGMYHPFDSSGCPPVVVPFSLIECQLARGTIDCWNPSFWITTTLSRVSINHTEGDDNNDEMSVLE